MYPFLHVRNGSVSPSPNRIDALRIARPCGVSVADADWTYMAPPYKSPLSVGYPQTNPQGTSFVAEDAIKYHSDGNTPQSLSKGGAPGFGRWQTVDLVA